MKLGYEEIEITKSHNQPPHLPTTPRGILPSSALLCRLAKPGCRLHHIPAEAVATEEAGAHLRSKNKL